jgi:hypothetical protein
MKKLYVFKLQERWCAVEDTSMEGAKAYAYGFLSMVTDPASFYHDTQREAFAGALRMALR